MATARPSGRPTMTGTTRASRWPGVFGLLDQPAPMACFRLVINGLYKSLPHHPWQGPLALASMPDAGEPGAGRDGWVLRLVRRWHSA